MNVVGAFYFIISEMRKAFMMLLEVKSVKKYMAEGLTQRLR